jgi:hypothetical protein
MTIGSICNPNVARAVQRGRIADLIRLEQDAETRARP